MAKKFTSVQPEVTQQGAQFDAPWAMTKAWLRFSAFVTLAVTALLVGVVSSVAFRAWEPLLAGIVLFFPLALIAWLLWVFTVRTQRMIYRDERSEKAESRPHVIIEMTDNIKTPKGWVEKGTKQVDVGASPAAVLEALTYMKKTGKTSRDAVCANTALGQKPWKRLKDVLTEYNIIVDGVNGVSDEIDLLIAQVETQIRDL